MEEWSTAAITTTAIAATRTTTTTTNATECNGEIFAFLINEFELRRME
jgi:hypothetical protein